MKMWNNCRLNIASQKESSLRRLKNFLSTNLAQLKLSTAINQRISLSDFGPIASELGHDIQGSNHFATTAQNKNKTAKAKTKTKVSKAHKIRSFRRKSDEGEK